MKFVSSRGEQGSEGGVERGETRKEVSNLYHYSEGNENRALPAAERLQA